MANPLPPRPPKGTRWGGRVKGTPNKSTGVFRDTITKLLEDNSANIATWLASVAKDDPAKALDLISRLAEFAAPKLGRTEIAGDIEHNHTVRVVDLTGKKPDAGT